MSGTSKKSLGQTERKMRHIGETCDQGEVQALSTKDLVERAEDDLELSFSEVEKR